MAWTAPSTFVAGAILTAAQLNTNVRDNTLAGGPIYATEALRDAAITSPFEGQRAYITGSTVASATGGITGIPTGIQTIYNGAAWVCVTPVSAAVSTSESRNNNAYGALATAGPSITLSTGTQAIISVNCWMQIAANIGGYAAVAVSGATTIAATEINGIRTYQGVAAPGLEILTGANFLISGLSAGTNTFTMQYKTFNGSVAFSDRRLVGQGIA